MHVLIFERDSRPTLTSFIIIYSHASDENANEPER